MPFKTRVHSIDVEQQNLHINEQMRPKGNLRKMIAAKRDLGLGVAADGNVFNNTGLKVEWKPNERTDTVGEEVTE